MQKQRPNSLRDAAQQQAEQLIRQTQRMRRRVAAGLVLAVAIMLLGVLAWRWRNSEVMVATATPTEIVPTATLPPTELVAGQFVWDEAAIVWEVHVVAGERPIANQPVTFSLQPPNAASLLDQMATTDAQGRATVRIADIEASNVRILASLPDQRVEATIPTEFVTQPQLSVSVDALRTSDAAIVGEDIVVQFLVRNTSPVDARGVRLHSPVPSGTRFVDSNTCALDGSEIVCEIGIVTADAQGYDPQFTLNVLETDGVQLAGFYLTDGNGNRFESDEQLDVAVVAAQLSRIVLLSENDQLLADGAMTTTLTVELYDQQLRPFDAPTDISFIVAASQPGVTDTGTLAQTALQVQQQESISYTVGSEVAFVDITAFAGTISETVRLTLRQETTWAQVPVGAERRRPGRHLYYQPTDNVNFELALFGLSPNTAVTLFPQKEGAFQKATIDIWLPSEGVDIQDTGEGVLLRRSQPFYVGDTPRIDKFLTNGDMITINAYQHRVPVLQQEGDFTQVRFEGWLLVGEE